MPFLTVCCVLASAGVHRYLRTQLSEQSCLICCKSFVDMLWYARWSPVLLLRGSAYIRSTSCTSCTSHHLLRKIAIMKRKRETQTCLPILQLLLAERAKPASLSSHMIWTQESGLRTKAQPASSSTTVSHVSRTPAPAFPSNSNLRAPPVLLSAITYTSEPCPLSSIESSILRRFLGLRTLARRVNVTLPKANVLSGAGMSVKGQRERARQRQKRQT